MADQAVTGAPTRTERTRRAAARPSPRRSERLALRSAGADTAAAGSHTHRPTRARGHRDADRSPTLTRAGKTLPPCAPAAPGRRTQSSGHAIRQTARRRSRRKHCSGGQLCAHTPLPGKRTSTRNWPPHKHARRHPHAGTPSAWTRHPQPCPGEQRGISRRRATKLVAPARAHTRTRSHTRTRPTSSTRAHPDRGALIAFARHDPGQHENHDLARLPPYRPFQLPLCARCPSIHHHSPRLILPPPHSTSSTRPLTLAAAPPPVFHLHAWAGLPGVSFGRSRKGGPARQRWTPLPRKPRRRADLGAGGGAAAS